MNEHQQVEWKESWRDEYLKWISAFANAEGGLLVIGKNDRGQVVGVRDAQKLLVDLPNKVRDVLGILVKVNLRESGGTAYVEIAVDPYPYPVSYKGEYHVRSGSTKQELKGAALDRFLLGKQGRHWDGVPVPGVAVADLSPARRSQRPADAGAAEGRQRAAGRQAASHRRRLPQAGGGAAVPPRSRALFHRRQSQDGPLPGRA